MIGDKLEELAEKQAQAVDALCLLLDGLDSEGRQVTQGPAAAENFVGRLQVYMGALHLITDTLEATVEALERMAQQIDGKEEKENG